MKKRILIIFIVAFLLLSILIVCVFSWVNKHQYLFIKDDSEIVGMTLNEVEEKYGKFYYHETYIYSDDSHQADYGYYRIRPRLPALIGSLPPKFFIISFKDEIATGYRVEETNELYGDGSDKNIHNIYLDGIWQAP